MNPMFCQIGVASGKCGACNPGTHHCVATQLQMCTESGVYMQQKTCDSAALCSEAAGDCTPMLCVPNAKTCSSDGSTLQTCNADGSGYTTNGMTCGANLCDATNHRCNKCIPNATRCSGTTVMTCSNDGQSETLSACTAANDCSTASCSAGACQNGFKLSGTKCTGSNSSCDGSGNCVAAPTCATGLGGPSANCDPANGWFTSAPANICDTARCMITDALYQKVCDAMGPAWNGSIWSCSNTGVPSIACNGNSGGCITTNNRGSCVSLGQGTFCAIPCSQGCPAGLTCVVTDPATGVKDTCGYHDYKAW
jgi:hypothetical protein